VLRANLYSKNWAQSAYPLGEKNDRKDRLMERNRVFSGFFFSYAEKYSEIAFSIHKGTLQFFY